MNDCSNYTWDVCSVITNTPGYFTSYIELIVISFSFLTIVVICVKIYNYYGEKKMKKTSSNQHKKDIGGKK